MSNPRREDTFQKSIDENPFKGLIIDSDEILEKLEGRFPCSNCGKSRKYFCYTCYVPIAELSDLLPAVKLPLKIDIIKHKNEIDGKSTAVHAAVLAPNDVQIFTYPGIPNYEEEIGVVLIYPSFDAIEVCQLFGETETIEPNIILPKGYHKTTLRTEMSFCCPKFTYEKNGHENLPVKKAVFIDSTWNQSKGIFKDKRIRNLRCVVIQNRISQFWRHQKGSPRWYLSTIEAIHQFLLEVHLNKWGFNPEYRGIDTCFIENKYKSTQSCNGDNLYNGQYDNLLFFFKHMYKLIHSYYDHDMLYAYKRKML